MRLKDNNSPEAPPFPAKGFITRALAGFLTCGSLPILTFPAVYQWYLRMCSPLTVARPSGILTRFPFTQRQLLTAGT